MYTHSRKCQILQELLHVQEVDRGVLVAGDQDDGQVVLVLLEMRLEPSADSFVSPLRQQAARVPTCSLNHRISKSTHKFIVHNRALTGLYTMINKRNACIPDVYAKHAYTAQEQPETGLRAIYTLNGC